MTTIEQYLDEHFHPSEGFTPVRVTRMADALRRVVNLHTTKGFCRRCGSEPCEERRRIHAALGIDGKDQA